MPDQDKAPEIHLSRLSVFLCGGVIRPDIAMPNEDYIGISMSDISQGTLRSVSDFSDGFEDGPYRLGILKNHRKVVLVFQGPCDELDVVGEYDGCSLNIIPEHRGFGMGRLLVLATALWLPEVYRPSEFTVAGYAAHVSAHRTAVELALARGDPISDDVVADHPRLLEGRDRRAPSRR